MKKFKQWMIERFLPIYLREQLEKENKKLQEQNQELRVRIRELNAYAEGLEYGLRSQRRITINNQQDKTPMSIMNDPNYKPPEGVKQ